MSLRPDHKALVFLGAVAVLGAGVRVSRAASRSVSSPATQPALDRQMASADSAANAGRSGAGQRRSSPRGGRRPAGRPREWSSDSASSPTDSARESVAQEGRGATHRAGLHQWQARSRRRDRRADRFAAGRAADDRQTHRRGSNAARTVSESRRTAAGQRCRADAGETPRLARHVLRRLHRKARRKTPRSARVAQTEARRLLRDLRRGEQRRRDQRRRAAQSRVAARRLRNERRRRGEVVSARVAITSRITGASWSHASVISPPTKICAG